MTPVITVLMAVHNGEAFLQETLESVLAQDFSDFEFVVVDDSSSDASPVILAEAAATDSRIRVFRNEENLGLTRSLNIGLQQACGIYVARSEAGDTCLPGRLSRQHSFLESHKDHVAVACGFHVIDARGGKLMTVDVGLDDWQIRWLSGFNPPAPHPAYFFRRLMPDGTQPLYDEDFETAQDFDFWSRLSDCGKTAVLPDVLINYRRHDGAITVSKRKEQAANCKIIGWRNLRRRLPADIVARLDPLLALFAYGGAGDTGTIAAAVIGCDAMLAYDLPAAPTARHRRWIRRTAAGLLADAILSRAGALRSVSGTVAFLLYARSYLPALLMAVLSQPKMALKSLRAVGRV